MRATLFDAGTDTQLLFELRGMGDDDAEDFNRLSDARGDRGWDACSKLLAARGVDADFVGCKSEVLENNLLYVRDGMAEMLAWLYRESLLVDTGTTSLAALCERMVRQNPLGFRVLGVYEKAVKDLLVAALSGMTGSRPWDGIERNSSGYVVVLPDGEEHRFSVLERERFRDYLLDHAFIERVDCREYGWGRVERDARGRFVLPLNAGIGLEGKPKSVTRSNSLQEQSIENHNAYQGGIAL